LTGARRDYVKTIFLLDVSSQDSTPIPHRRGWVKVGNFSRSDNKKAYLYKLTPKGVREKARVARRFLHRKLEEQDRITAEIDTLRRELSPAEQSGIDQLPSDEADSGRPSPRSKRHLISNEPQPE